MVNASLYARLSKKAGEANLSFEGMVTDLRALADRLGCRVIAEHADDGKSGAVRDRPEFVGWLDDARSGRADVLLAYHADRLTREGVNAAAMVLDVLEGKDPTTGAVVRPPVRLVSWDGLDSERDAESFRWRFVIAAEVARAERERIRARAKATRSRLARAGRWPGGPPPYGYRVVQDGPGKALAIEPEEAEAIKWAASEVVAGVPLGRVARRLSEKGYAPRRTSSWSRTVLRQILTSDHVLGRVTLHGSVVRDEEGRPLTPYEPILDLATVTALSEALTPSLTRSSPGRQPSRLLSGLLTCHACGSTLQVARRSNGSVTYRCQRQSDGGLCKAQVVVSALPIENFMEDTFLRSFGRLPVFEKRVTVVGAGDLAEVEDRISALTASLAQAAKPETFEALQLAQADRDAIQARPRETYLEMIETGRTYGDDWLFADVHGRREMLRDAYLVLELGPGRRGPRGFDPKRLTLITRP